MCTHRVFEYDDTSQDDLGTKRTGINDGWKRVNKEVEGCYYQASRLVKLVNDELHRFTMQEFVSKKWAMYKAMFADKDVQDTNVFCALSNDYQKYLREIELNEDGGQQDEFRKMVCMFLHMSDDFTIFVESCHSSDVIATIKGHDWFVPVWTSFE